MTRRISPKKPKQRKRIVSPHFFNLILFVIILVTLFWGIPKKKANYLDPSSMITLHIPRGTPFLRIADSLQMYGLIDSKGYFYVTSRLLGKTDRLQAGTYRIPGGLRYGELVQILSKATPLQIRLTIPEGLEYEEIADIVSPHFSFTREDFLKYKDSTELFNFPFKVTSLEGFLFPETYDFYEHVTPYELINRMVRQFLTIVDSEMQAEILQKGFTVEEIITLASIIQGEAMIHDEMPLISSVYHNRLKRGMKLQADPTIQYLIPGPKIRLRARHLEIDSPFNTYLYPGLPPSPANSPGKIAIIAAFRPDTTNYLYFVARGDGSHVFSRTHREHLKAKQDFQRVRRDVYRRQKINEVP
jgi:UPF0755 protein